MTLDRVESPFAGTTASGPVGLRPGENCWRIERASRATVIVDAADYFRAARSAMLEAKHRIMLVGWDFDARINLTPDDDFPDAPGCLGDFVLWLVRRRPELEVFVLRWDLGVFKVIFRGSTFLTLLRWKAHPALLQNWTAFIHPPPRTIRKLWYWTIALPFVAASI